MHTRHVKNTPSMCSSFCCAPERMYRSAWYCTVQGRRKRKSEENVHIYLIYSIRVYHKPFQHMSVHESTLKNMIELLAKRSIFNCVDRWPK